MREIYAKEGAELLLGKRGENNAACVVFDISAWRSLHGYGVVTLLCQRNGDKTPYPCVVEASMTSARWIITNTETDKPGTGRVELQYWVGDTIAKSATWGTRVHTAMGAAGETPPEPGQTWLEELQQISVAVKEDAGEAEASAQAALASERNARTHADNSKIYSDAAKAVLEAVSGESQEVVIAVHEAAQYAAQAAASADAATDAANTAVTSVTGIDASVAAAAASAKAAAQSEEEAEGWSINARSSADTASANAQLSHNNMKRSETAREAAEAAADRAEAAASGGGGGGTGEAGEDGATFTPSVSSDGTLSWTNDKGLPNPAPVNIKGPRGYDGYDGDDGADGKTPVKGVDYFTAQDQATMVAQVRIELEDDLTELENDIRANGNAITAMDGRMQVLENGGQAVTGLSVAKAEDGSAVFFVEDLADGSVRSIKMTLNTDGVPTGLTVDGVSIPISVGGF